MPPTDNNLTRSDKRNHWHSTAEYRAFKHEVMIWELSNRAAIQSIKEELRAPLNVHMDLYFERSKILCKNGRTKKMDGPNRIKALHDAISRIIGIDDSEFWQWSGEKHISPNSLNYVTIRISNLEEHHY
jgi:Holliday junction resolvase RusA-like endonuclease